MSFKNGTRLKWGGEHDALMSCLHSKLLTRMMSFRLINI